MSTERLGEALQRLREVAEIGEQAQNVELPGRFSTLVDVVAGPEKFKPDGEEAIPLDRAEELVDLPLEVLQETLKKTGRDSRRAAALLGLAAWWPGDDPEEAWRDDHQRRREELTAIRGIGHELVDRILLVVLEVPTMPLSRSALRIGCRHGWSGLESEYDEWQHLFGHSSEVSGIPLRQIDLLINWIGQSHCGPRPKCEGCPLEPLLPDGGPYEPE